MVCDSESGPISLSLSLLSVYGLLLMSQAANGFLLVQPLGVGHGTSSVSRAALQLSPAASRTSRTPRRYRRGTRRSCLCASASSTPSLSPSSRFDDDGGLIVGLNKYSHDSAICIMRGRDGKVLFGCEKVRVGGRLHVLVYRQKTTDTLHFQLACKTACGDVRHMCIFDRQTRLCWVGQAN